MDLVGVPFDDESLEPSQDVVLNLACCDYARIVLQYEQARVADLCLTTTINFLLDSLTSGIQASVLGVNPLALYRVQCAYTHP